MIKTKPGHISRCSPPILQIIATNLVNVYIMTYIELNLTRPLNVRQVFLDSKEQQKSSLPISLRFWRNFESNGSHLCSK